MVLEMDTLSWFGVEFDLDDDIEQRCKLLDGIAVVWLGGMDVAHATGVANTGQNGFEKQRQTFNIDLFEEWVQRIDTESQFGRSESSFLTCIDFSHDRIGYHRETRHCDRRLPTGFDEQCPSVRARCKSIVIPSVTPMFIGPG